MAIGKWGKYNARLVTEYYPSVTRVEEDYQLTESALYSSYTILGDGNVIGAGSLINKALGVSGYWFDSTPRNFMLHVANLRNIGIYVGTLTVYHINARQSYVQGSFIQNVTATTGTYPSNARHTDGFWYVYIGLVPPNAPPTLTVPATITGGKSSSISWGQATTEGAAISGYELHRSLNYGTFAQVYRGANLTHADTVPYGTNTVQYSVRSYDVDNQKSAFKVGEVKNVINNNPPVITCIATDMGEIDTGFTVQYSVSDEDTADTITVTEAIDGVILRSFSATRDVEYTINLSNESTDLEVHPQNNLDLRDSEEGAGSACWLRLLNGLHTLTITAVDNRGGTAVKSIKFTKAVHEIEFELTTPLTCDAAVTKAMMQMLAVVPAGALVQIFACNNGFDEAPTWVDVTLKVLNNEKIFFANEVKTAENWGYNVRVHIDRNGAQGDCFVTSIGGNFE